MLGFSIWAPWTMLLQVKIIACFYEWWWILVSFWFKILVIVWAVHWKSALFACLKRFNFYSPSLALLCTLLVVDTKAVNPSNWRTETTAALQVIVLEMGSRKTHQQIHAIVLDSVMKSLQRWLFFNPLFIYDKLKFRLVMFFSKRGKSFYHVLH